MTSFRSAMVISVMWSTLVAAVEWMELSSSGDVPSGRSRHTMTVLHDGSAVMFGGYKEGTSHFLNDIYTLRVTGTIATWVQLSSSGDVPSGRSRHTMTVLHDGSAVMFGGYKEGTSHFLNDIYTLRVTGTIATWVQLLSAGDVPSGRSRHTMTVHHDGSAVMFGGYKEGTSHFLNDIYTLRVTGTIAMWVQLLSAGDVPRGRSGHTMTVLHDGSAVMFGGHRYVDGNYYLNDIRTLKVNGTIATWGCRVQVTFPVDGGVTLGRCLPTVVP